MFAVKVGNEPPQGQAKGDALLGVETLAVEDHGEDFRHREQDGDENPGEQRAPDEDDADGSEEEGLPDDGAEHQNDVVLGFS
ncbi:unnamed protein product [Linum trigynum]|uniref:Uncharacterized protein n=1 Tax=Linum trigynum TaxID=586398 RepID=A0AAV2FC28_9ROSI